MEAVWQQTTLKKISFLLFPHSLSLFLKPSCTYTCVLYAMLCSRQCCWISTETWRDTVPSVSSQPRASVWPTTTCTRTRTCTHSCTTPLKGGLRRSRVVSSHKWISPHISLSIKEPVCAQAAVRATPPAAVCVPARASATAAATCYLPYFVTCAVSRSLSPIRSSCSLISFRANLELKLTARRVLMWSRWLHLWELRSSDASVVAKLQVEPARSRSALVLLSLEMRLDCGSQMAPEQRLRSQIMRIDLIEFII